MTMIDPQLMDRLERMEHQIRLLSAQAGLPYDDAVTVPGEVIALARGDERIKAALRLTEMTGLDFTEAQRVVGRL
jgi:hypothetical protein